MTRINANLIFKEESYNIIGAAIDVHNELGNGFLEAIYQEALETEFINKKIPYKREVSLPVYYRGKLLSKSYIADFICYEKIILELKALSAILPEHKAQVINYLKATNFRLGIIINFGEKSLKHHRLINSWTFE